MQNLIRFIAELCIFNSISPWWEHIKGDYNNTADRLSRFHPNPWEFARVSPANTKSAATQTLQNIIDRFGQK